MHVSVKHRWSGNTIYVAEDVTSLNDAILQAVAAGVDLRGSSLSRANLHGASLHGADLSDADLSGADLRGAYLRNANLSSADLSSACLTGANLSGAKLFGAKLSDADLRNANLSSADLSGAALSRAHLCGANLSGAKLFNTDLSDADLFGAHLFNADLSGVNLCYAELSNTDLSGTDLSALGLDIPIVEHLDARVLTAITSEGGTLYMLSWHGSLPSDPVCGSTHCRAGWAVHLAGEAGYALERAVGSSAAGALIYAKSTGRPVPNFHASTEIALEDIKRCAALGPQSTDA